MGSREFQVTSFSKFFNIKFVGKWGCITWLQKGAIKLWLGINVFVGMFILAPCSCHMLPPLVHGTTSNISWLEQALFMVTTECKYLGFPTLGWEIPRDCGEGICRDGLELQCCSSIHGQITNQTTDWTKQICHFANWTICICLWVN